MKGRVFHCRALAGIAVLAAFAVALALSACGGRTAPAASSGTPAPAAGVPAGEGARPEIKSDFLVGYGEGDITPYNMSVPLMGYGDSSLRMSVRSTTLLYSRAIAVQDKEGSTALMISVDSAALTENFCTAVCQQIQQKAGVDKDRIMLSAIHQHSTPDYSSSAGDAQAYKSAMIASTVQAAIDALADLSPAEMYITSVEAEHLTFVRNYICEDGSFTGPNYPSSSPIKDHESVADVTMQLLKFVRGGDKKDILVTNFQTHPLMGSNYASLEAHADVVGPYRDYVEEELDVHCVYFSGAAGNLKPYSEIKSENVATDMWDWGERLGEYTLSAEGTYTKVETGPVKASAVGKRYDTDKSQEELYPIAAEFMKIWNAEGQVAASKALKNFPELHSIYHGKYVVVKHDLPPTRAMKLYAISFGDVAFTGTPCELYDQIGDQIKADSPAKMTIVTTQTNGADGYIPSALGYRNGGYSVDITRYAAGTGEQIARDLVEMITELRK